MPEPPRVLLREGRLHIPAAVFDGHLAGSTAVALLARDGQWWLMPLLAGAGGLQIKLRNPRGDRVVESQEFFRGQGWEDAAAAIEFTLQFDKSRGAFRLEPAVE